MPRCSSVQTRRACGGLVLPTGQDLKTSSWRRGRRAGTGDLCWGREMPLLFSTSQSQTLRLVFPFSCTQRRLFLQSASLSARKIQTEPRLTAQWSHTHALCSSGLCLLSLPPPYKSRALPSPLRHSTARAERRVLLCIQSLRAPSLTV